MNGVRSSAGGFAPASPRAWTAGRAKAPAPTVVWLLALLLFACGAPPAEDKPSAVEQSHELGEVSIVLRVDRNPFTVAQSALLSIEAVAPEGSEAVFPSLDELPEDLQTSEPKLSDPRLVDGGRLAQIFEVELEALLPGEYEIPSLKVVVDEAAIETNPFLITVESVLGADADQASIEEIVDPVEIAFPKEWIVAGVLAAAALAALVYWLWRRRRGPKGELGPPPPPPHETALAELDALLARNLLREGREKLFYNLLSGILRRYIEERFGLRAPELTTEEFLDELRTADSLDREQKDLLRAFLRECDLVKFAEVLPSGEQADGAVAACRGFVEQTRPTLAEAELAEVTTSRSA